jgi:hypothetical protein
MIEMRENSYNNIRTDEVQRTTEKTKQEQESLQDRRKSEDGKEPDKFDLYDPWC